MMIRLDCWLLFAASGYRLAPLRGILPRHGDRRRPLEKTYRQQKVVYDVSVKTVAQLEQCAGSGQLSFHRSNDADPFDSKIVIVLHGDEIGFFAIRNFEKYKDLMTRAQSLTVGGIIDIRMCQVSARRRGFEAPDIHGFVTMVPMADAEISDLQKQGFAYMQYTGYHRGMGRTRMHALARHGFSSYFRSSPFPCPGSQWTLFAAP